MKKTTYTFIHFASYLTIIHGILYWIVKEFYQQETAYGLRPHEYQTYIQAIHIVLSPLLIIALGILWQNHIVAFFKKRSKKLISGITLTITLIIISFSGYFVQVIYNPSAKEVTILIHLVFSALFVVAYLTHHFLSIKRK